VNRLLAEAVRQFRNVAPPPRAVKAISEHFNQFGSRSGEGFTIR
jgi:hypothetical protein